VLAKIAPGTSDELMLGFETSDDAAVYRLSHDMVALLTVDFFTPIVDDPYDFGRIAAANALSDIYAMGGRPLTAMNLLAFPCAMGPEVVGEVVRGGAEKVAEAGAVIVGGHTIDDAEPKYGLSVMGVAAPGAVVRNAGARAGDALVLTKPIGTGIITTAIKRGLEDEDSARDVIESMAALNKAAAEAMAEVGVRAATDVTGFGLLGHTHEMVKASGCSARIECAAVPLFERALDYARREVVPGRTAELVEWGDGFATWSAGPAADTDVDTWMRVLCDPQTSGGLLLAVAPERASALARSLESRGVRAARVGECCEGEPGAVEIVPAG
jgi:selenide, water dikinase